MALPKIATPFYELKLPSSGETVKYRPFIVKEEKLLLMAMESGKQKEISNVMKQIIRNCTDDSLNVEELPMFDIEYLFLQLRIKSIEDVAELSFKCKKCDEVYQQKVDLKKVKVEFPKKDQDFKIQLTHDVGIIMKYPTLNMMDDMEAGDEEKPEFIFDTITKCVSSIYDEKQIYDSFTKEEIDEFIESLPQEQFKKISTFFENMPKLQHKFNFTCPKCKEKNNITITGLQDFFDSPSLTTP